VVIRHDKPCVGAGRVDQAPGSPPIALRHRTPHPRNHLGIEGIKSKELYPGGED